MSDRIRLSRRTVLQTFGLLGSSSATTVTACPRTGRPAERSNEGTRYVGVVDRIVDGRHVVILLEDGGDVVDQLVVPTTRFDGIAERDRLLVTVENGKLQTVCRLPIDRPSTRR